MSSIKVEEKSDKAVIPLTKFQLYFYTFLICITVFTGAMCYSLQAPIYPHEAENKDVPPSQYGFVFGVFQLIIFLSSPFYGIYSKAIGPLFMFRAGVFISAYCTILFGSLEWSPPKAIFFGLSVVIRIFGALGDSAIYTSSFVLAYRLYPNAMATSLAAVETAFGFGLIVGPTLGGCLYDLGGFSLPFFVIGGVLMAFCLMSLFLLKNFGNGGPTNVNADKLKVVQVLRDPAIIITAFPIFTVATATGFIQALLEPHLDPLNLTASTIGLLYFMAMGGAYAISSVINGRLADKIGHYNLICIFGMLLQVIGLTFLGPAPFIHFEITIGSVVSSLLVIGIGLGCVLINSVMSLLNIIEKSHNQNNLSAQGFVAGLYNSVYAFGCFLGPTIGGPLYDCMGFASASMVILGLQMLAGILIIGLGVGKYLKHRSQQSIVV